MRVLILCFLAFIGVFAENNSSIDKNTTQILISDINSQIAGIDASLKSNAWITRYANYNTYQKIKAKLEDSEKALKKSDKSAQRAELSKQIQTLKEQLSLLKEYENAPFLNMLMAPEIDSPPRIINPVELVSGFSYIKKVASDLSEYKKHILELDTLVSKLENKESLLVNLLDINYDEISSDKLSDLRQEIGDFKGAKQIADTTLNVLEKKVDEAINITKNEIKSQLLSMLNIAIFIIATIAISFFFKFVAKRTISDDERFYTVNKFINFINVLLIVVILLFAYIENVTYIVTVLGFASAGIAIAMKDMFMSMLGWVVIIFGSSFHVGDRIKVSRSGVTHVGDIIDISLLRITMLEDVTLSTYLDGSRRAGRIIFIPNNYIFTDLISNYSHYGMKTVWDGIDICISFDSNHKKAVYIAKTIVRKYSKGYTDIAKRQMNKLRSQYSIKNPNVEPRVFTFFESYGINISIWYMANSYATLVLRSTISAELIDAFNKEDDIRIAYPTQTMYMARKSLPHPHTELELEGSNE
ncbi:membrane protein [Campylobacter mucosalis]|uniref:mechanosensitive ion channel domain-containing protein n=1 Tax=Campylobacter mucosalis TaxID=202 RepID=UPI0004D9E522|nr:mechanosensitive ion channel domain-containing protein [Campylobacter mucosalis]KEA46544.1 membrane protein [Campylobacter mucosalis]QKF62956.1 mechanosensitive ion channel family protein [Campylobacter mucosalis]